MASAGSISGSPPCVPDPFFSLGSNELSTRALKLARLMKLARGGESGASGRTAASHGGQRGVITWPVTAGPTSSSTPRTSPSSGMRVTFEPDSSTAPVRRWTTSKRYSAPFSSQSRTKKPWPFVGA